MLSKLRKLALVEDERGMTTLEYVILLCLVAVVAFGAWRKFGSTVDSRVKGARGQVGQLPTQMD